MASLEDTMEQTLSMFEERLSRIEYILHGDSAVAEDATGSHDAPPVSVHARLRALERSLSTLVAGSYAATDVVAIDAQHPGLFHASLSSESPPLVLDSSLAQMVLAHEQLYISSAAQLSSLNEDPDIPDSAALAKLVALQPRLDKVHDRQLEQAKEIAALRARSARLLEQWYQDGVLGMGDKWAVWEEKLREGEILLRRKEAAKKREDSMV